MTRNQVLPKSQVEPELLIVQAADCGTSAYCKFRERIWKSAKKKSRVRTAIRQYAVKPETDHDFTDPARLKTGPMTQIVFDVFSKMAECFDHFGVEPHV